MPATKEKSVLCRRCRQPYKDHDQELDFPGLPPTKELPKEWMSLALGGMQALGEASWSEKPCLECVGRATEKRALRAQAISKRSKARRQNRRR